MIDSQPEMLGPESYFQGPASATPTCGWEIIVLQQAAEVKQKTDSAHARAFVAGANEHALRVQAVVQDKRECRSQINLLIQ